MPPNRSRDLIYLKAYLRERSRHPFSNRDWPWGLVIPLGLIGIGAFSVFLAEDLPPWILILFVPLALVAMISSAVRISWGLQQPRNADEERVMHAFETAKFMSRAVYAHQVNPFAARLLEGCAYHRARILAAVDKPGWDQTHMRSVREQAIFAANEAMDDAMRHCANFAGPGHSRGSAWKDLAQDVAEGQIGDALARLSTMLEADKPGEIVDRRKLPTELWPVYDIAVKLQRLASEMEIAARQIPAEEALQTSSLDQVLSDLSAIRQAERELESDDPQQLRQY
ncbi:MAG TPA: hypothetical protein VHE55_08355 [Fimbriimonadaceae bacterium]|nr:hypothetical protein [Fimbriimonadaceae bacterium]